MLKERNLKLLLTLLLFAVMATAASAQCAFHNSAFKSGERLTYNLYFNWQFVWVKVGTASFDTDQTTFEGRQAYRGSLITRGNKRADNFFVLRDTLLCYTSTKMEPLYFRKGAREGSRYTVDEVFYSYPDGRQHVRLHRQKNDGTHIWKNVSDDQCVFDMLSIFMRARSFDPTGWKKGQTVNFPMADGRDLTPALIRYRGKTNVKADNGKKYRCLQLSYIERDGNKEKEIVRFYVSDDDNHVPVRLDMFLRFGSAKAFLVGMKGVRNEIKAEVK